MSKHPPKLEDLRRQPKPAPSYTYAKAGGPPALWPFIHVYDLETGEEVRNVYEVNTLEGWVWVFEKPTESILEQIQRRKLEQEALERGEKLEMEISDSPKRRIEGRFEIRLSD